MKSFFSSILTLMILMLTISCSNDSIQNSLDNTPEVQNTSYMRVSNSGYEEWSMEEITNFAQSHNDYLADIHNNYGDVINFNESEREAILVNYWAEMGYSDQETIDNAQEFYDKLSSLESLKQLYENQEEKNYVDEIDSALESAIDLADLNEKLNIIENDIQNNESENVYKTPLLIYAETLKKSAYYWAPIELGGQGNGSDILYERGGTAARGKWGKVTKADGLAAAGGFMALATYGYYLAFFGPVGATIATTSLGMIALGSAWASGIAAMS